MKKITKITQKQIAAAGVQALANRPNAVAQYGLSGLSPQELKLHFDKLATMIAEKVNELGDVLASDDAAQYIRIALDDYEVGSLSELIEAMQSGEFAEKILYVFPSANSFMAVPIQQAIFGIAQAIADNEEATNDLKNYIEGMYKPQLYAPTALASMEESYDEYDSIRVYDDDRNGYQDLNGEPHYFTRGFNFYVDGVLKRKYQVGPNDRRDKWFLLSDIVDPGTEGKVTVTAYGGSFDLEFRESPHSDKLVYSNIVNFTVNGIPYVAGKNMTWISWIFESGLSPEGFRTNEGEYVYFNGNVVIDNTFTRVRAESFIYDGRIFISAETKRFTVADLHNITSADGGDSFEYIEGMTWADWKASEYNAFLYQNSKFEFKAYGNMLAAATDLNIAVEGIGYKSGDPVEDGDLIEATEYGFYEYDYYDPRTSFTATLEAGATSKTLFEGEGYRKITLNGIDGLTDAVSSIVVNDNGTVTVNYETDTDIEITVHYIGFKKQN